MHRDLIIPNMRNSNATVNALEQKIRQKIFLSWIWSNEVDHWTPQRGKIYPQFENIKVDLKRGWLEIIREEIEVEHGPAKEGELNNLDKIKVKFKNVLT